MALSPGIPTSFVPKQPTPKRSVRLMASGNNLFLVISLFVAGLSVAIAAGVFIYDKLLERTLASRQAELSTAQANVDESTIEEFVRLRDRLDSGGELLTNHVVLSQFFDVLESITLQNVRFDSLNITVAGDHTAKLVMDGTARNFNSLAAQSNTFASEKRIKRAIFSGIAINEARQIEFKMTADIDPKLVIQGTVEPAKAVVPVTPISSGPDLPPVSTTSPTTKPTTITATSSNSVPAVIPPTP